MSKQLIVNDEHGVRHLSVPTGTSRLGSAADCELRLDHEEVQPLALTIDCRGETLLVHNRNPFAIYLGEEELQPGQMAPWHENTTLSMTRSISLTLEGERDATDGGLAEETESAEKKSGITQRQMIQLGIIALCAVVGFWQLNREPNSSVRAQIKDFDEVLASVAAKIEATKAPHHLVANSQWRDVMRLLQEAYFLEIRPGQPDARPAIEAYQRVLETDLIRNAKLQEEQQVESEVFRFATAKKVLLNGR